MSADPKKTLPRIRTFAHDLEVERQKSGLPLPTGAKAPPAVKPTLAAPAFAKEVLSVADRKISNDVTHKEDKDTHIKSPEQKHVISVRVPATPPAQPTHTIQPAPVKKINVRTKKQNFKEAKSVPGGTIITDGKRGDFKLAPSLLDSVVTWFTVRAKELTKKRTPTYTIVDTSRRKGVIQKATSKTGAIFTADNETLREEILKRKATQIVTAPIAEREISWSPNTEVGYPLLTSGEQRPPAAQKVTIEFKKRSVPTPIIVEPTVVIPPVESIPEPVVVPIEIPVPVPSQLEIEVASLIEPMAQLESVPEEIVSPPPVVVIPIIEVPEPEIRKPVYVPPVIPVVATQPVIQPIIPVAPQVVLPPFITKIEEPIEIEKPIREIPTVTIAPKVEPKAFEAPPAAMLVAATPYKAPVLPEIPLEVEELPLAEEEYLLTTPEEHYKIRSIGDVTRINTNLLSLGVLGIITIIIVLTILIRGLIGFFGSTNETLVIAPVVAINEQSSVVDVPIEILSKEALQIALEGTVDTPTLMTEFRLIDAKQVPVETQTLLTLIGFAGSQNLTQSITQAHIIKIYSQYGVIFNVADATSAFGSLLAWEDTMANDLSLFLNIDPTLQGTRFTDRTTGNTDIRILAIDGKEILVYGFLDKDTVLITKDSSAFTTALGQAQ